MQPVPGIQSRTLLRWTRYMQDQAKIERYKGRGTSSKPGIPEWESLADPIQCQVKERSGITRGPKGEDQQFDVEVVMQANTLMADPNARYRLTLTLYKGPLDEPATTPEVKRTRVVELASIQVLRDGAGNDCLQIARCVNARQDEG